MINQSNAWWFERKLEGFISQNLKICVCVFSSTRVLSVWSMLDLSIRLINIDGICSALCVKWPTESRSKRCRISSEHSGVLWHHNISITLDQSSCATKLVCVFLFVCFSRWVHRQRDGTFGSFGCSKCWSSDAQKCDSRAQLMAAQPWRVHYSLSKSVKDKGCNEQTPAGERLCTKSRLSCYR